MNDIIEMWYNRYEQQRRTKSGLYQYNNNRY
jgi:hypothetical protein